MNKKENNRKKIVRQMRFRFWLAALSSLVVILVLSFVLFQVYQHGPWTDREIEDADAAALAEQIDGILVQDGDTSALEEMRAVYENMSVEEQRQVTSQRYEKLSEAIELAERMKNEPMDIIVRDKSKNGLDMNIGKEQKAELKAYGGRSAFEGQADLKGKGAKQVFNKLFDGSHGFTVEVEMNPNDGGNFNMIFSKGDNTSAFRVEGRDAYFFIKNTAGEWIGTQEPLSDEQMYSWIHTAAVYNGNDIFAYLEGNEMKAVRNAGEIAASEFPLGIGYCPETKRPSVGSIRKFRVYSDPLTQEELDAGVYGPDGQNVELWYDFDDYSYQGLEAQAEGIRRYTDSLKVEEGGKALIRAEKVPYYAEGELIFQSDDEKVATVSRDGVVTGVKKGAASVTVMVKGTGYSEKIAIRVGEPLVDMQRILQWFVKWMVPIDSVAFMLVLLVTALIQRKYLISYLGKMSDAVLMIGRDNGEPELPDILSDAQHAIREVEKSFQEKKREVMEAEQKKNDLVVYLAHDLKTPIASIIGYLTLLRDERQISEELHQHYVEIALNSSMRLDDLINEFFEITRFNMSRITLNYREINLTWMLEQITSEFKPMLKEKELTCSLDIPRNVYLRCDPDKMERVFDNLLRNAINYSYHDTQISISVTVGERIVVTCENHGETISREQLSRIFEQFYRLDSSRSTTTGGSGLGLAIARQIVELHHGEIRAESRDEKIWFTVELPLHEPSGEA